jgi:hypothetical protein
MDPLHPTHHLMQKAAPKIFKLCLVQQRNCHIQIKYGQSFAFNLYTTNFCEGVLKCYLQRFIILQL